MDYVREEVICCEFYTYINKCCGICGGFILQEVPRHGRIVDIRGVGEGCEPKDGGD
jgi:hypothetical protein